MLIIALALTGCGAENENANTEEDTNAGNRIGVVYNG